MSWQAGAVSAEEAVSLIESGMKVFVHGACATPVSLLGALAARSDLEGVQLYHLHTSGTAAFAGEDQRGRLVSNSLFAGANVRAAIAEGRADFIPVFLSDIPRLFSSRQIPLDVAILQLSPPDKHGDCTLGPSIDTALAAAQSAKLLIAEINASMPRTTGDTVVPFGAVDRFVATSRPLLEHPTGSGGEVEEQIGRFVADLVLVDDGSTLQLGIGSIPDAVLRRLGDKNDLGIHTEMFSDSVIDLMQSGVVNNRCKVVYPGRTTTSFVAGSQRLFDFIDDNLMVEFYPCDRTNDTALIRKNPRVVAVNSAIEIDLTGQVCADSMGHTIFSGIGGQMDFIRGAAESEGGKPIIALPSTARGGTVSRITPELKPGAGVVTTRGHVHWVVTEFGAVNLHGMSLRQRAEALISIAHPEFRGELRARVRAIRHFDLGPSA